MLTLDRVYKASRVLKDVVRETDMILAPNIRKGTHIGAFPLHYSVTSAALQKWNRLKADF